MDWVAHCCPSGEVAVISLHVRSTLLLPLRATDGCEEREWRRAASYAVTLGAAAASILFRDRFHSRDDAAMNGRAFQDCNLIIKPVR